MGIWCVNFVRSIFIALIRQQGTVFAHYKDCFFWKKFKINKKITNVLTLP